MNYNKIEDLRQCYCGALTFYIDKVQFSVQEDNFEKFIGIPLNQLPENILSEFKELNKWSNCNHCVNHWGIDLCTCGSGESFENCDSNSSSCGESFQIIE